MTAAPIVEAFDERERRIARLELCLEPAAIEKLAFEGVEEIFAHGIVVCLADPTHRGAYARVTAAVAELDRGVLRTLVGVVDHARGPPRQKRHVQSVKYQLRGERGGHRDHRCRMMRRAWPRIRYHTTRGLPVPTQHA